MKRPTLDDPEYRRRVVRACLWVSPVGFLLAAFLGALQGASPAVCLLMGGVLALGCLGAAGLFHLRGSASARDAMWVIILLKLFGMR